jgi:hypothetical protein
LKVKRRNTMLGDCCGNTEVQSAAFRRPPEQVRAQGIHVPLLDAGGE